MPRQSFSRPLLQARQSGLEQPIQGCTSMVLPISTSPASGRDHFAEDLVAHGHRQLHAAIHHAKLSLLAQVEISVGDVDVRVADARAADADQHLGALRLGHLALARLKRLAELDQVIARVGGGHRFLPFPSGRHITAARAQGKAGTDQNGDNVQAARRARTARVEAIFCWAA